jgi:hypothetical protein
MTPPPSIAASSPAGAVVCLMFVSALNKKVAIWARVVSRPGQNLEPSPHPAVMPEAASLATSLAYQASSGTSENIG